MLDVKALDTEGVRIKVVFTAPAIAVVHRAADLGGALSVVG